MHMQTARKIIPSALLSAIPYVYAGVRVTALPAALTSGLGDAAEGAVANVEQQQYRVYNGYLVPYYEPKEHELSRRSEQLVLDRVKRFFYSAEAGLDVPWTHADIEQEIALCHIGMDAELKPLKNRYLAGAMVNRMGRLAQAILQANIDGIDIEIKHEDGEYRLTEAQLVACKAEFRAHYIFLIADEENSPVRHVRRQDGTPDYDGVLLDLVREMGKPLLMNGANESFLYSGLLQKIGYAMEAIDEVHSLMLRMIEMPHIASAMQLPTREHGMQYATMLDEFTACCRARSGLRAQDRANFGPVRERIACLRERMQQMHASLDAQSHIRGYIELHKVQSLLNYGVELMRDMAMIRYPRNHRCCEHAAADNSSVGRFSTAIEVWQRASTGTES